MRTNGLRALAALAMMGGLSACATDGGYQSSSVYDPAIRGEVEQQLAQSASRAANALETLAMIQRARTEPAAPALDESGLPPELKRRTTIEWSGPALEVVRELAGNIGYAFVESGNPPSAPGMVSIDVKDVSVAKALEDVGLQAQRFATVVVDPNARRIEFRHETVEGSTPRAAARAAAAPAPRRRAAAPVRRVRVQTAAECNCGPTGR